MKGRTLLSNARIASVFEQEYSRCERRRVAVDPHIHGFVLAGGQSSRMGVDKARLELNGQPLLLRMLNLLRPYVNSIAVLGSAGAYSFVHDPIIPDPLPGKGPLAAILTGLEYLPSDWAIFLACDAPLLSRGFIELLLRFITKSDSDAVVPRTRHGWQPLCAAYRTTSIPRIHEVLGEGDFAIVRALARLRVDVITSSDLVVAGLPESIFENANRPQDWERILRLTDTHFQ